jgi:DNA-directed RNA polymerase specialized sigma24 family protein
MTAATILTEIYLSKEVEQVIKKLKPDHLQEDIKQHTFLELFQKEADFIIDLHSRNKLKSYIVKILYNTATYTRSTFAKQQGKETPTDFNDNTMPFFDGEMNMNSKRCNQSTFEVIRFEEEEKERIEIESSVACAASSIHWYKFKLLEMYAELGTYQSVSDATGIPLTSVFQTISEARKEIKQRL